MASTMRVESSAFDSSHYERKIGRLVAEPHDASGPGEGATTALEGELTRALASARAAGFAVVFVRVDAHEPLRDVLDAAGHRPIDVLVTSVLDRSTRSAGVARTTAACPGIVISHELRLEVAADLRAIEQITMESMQTSHLHADPRLPLDRTRQLYAAWARNDVTGRAQRTLVARVEGVSTTAAADAIVGYLTVLETSHTAVIDLIAVAPGWQGKGVGTALLDSFVAWSGERDLTASVGTQESNPALALYARCGFVPATKQLTYHLWLDVPAMEVS